MDVVIVFGKSWEVERTGALMDEDVDEGLGGLGVAFWKL